MVIHPSHRPLLPVSAQRAHPSFSPSRHLTSRPSIFFFSFFSSKGYERRCPPRSKLCRSWRQDTRAPSPTFLFHLFWTTERTCLYLAARMETQCSANGPAIGSAPLSDTRARFGAPNSVEMAHALRREVRISQRAFDMHASRRVCAVALTDFTVRFGILTAGSHSTRSRIITSSAVSRSPHRPCICLPGDKKRRSEYSIQGDQMRCQISYPMAMGNRTTAQSRASYALTRILV